MKISSDHFLQAKDEWFKSSYSSGSCTCVEVRFDANQVWIRDSKYLLDPGNDPADQPMIETSHEVWLPFLEAVAGKVPDTTESELVVEIAVDGAVTLRSRTSDVALVYTPEEWVAFEAGVVDGEFAPALTPAR